MDWVTGIGRAVDYIEAHLTEEIDYKEVAAACYSSPYHFQRVFGILCGFTVGEYIRARRLSLAGVELARGEAKVIDVALKYGYESPDSFTKAFQRFHGVLPSKARAGCPLKTFSRLVLKLSLEGGQSMTYRMEQKSGLTVTGCTTRFTGAPADRQQQEHDYMVKGETRFIRYALQGMAQNCSLEYAVVSDVDGEGYGFTVGNVIPTYLREHLEKTVGAENARRLTVQVVPPATYLVVETERGLDCMNEQFDLRRRALSEWFADNPYQLADAPEVTLFHHDRIHKENGFVELWLPIEKL